MENAAPNFGDKDQPELHLHVFQAGPIDALHDVCAILYDLGESVIEVEGYKSQGFQSRERLHRIVQPF